MIIGRINGKQLKLNEDKNKYYLSFNFHPEEHKDILDKTGIYFKFGSSAYHSVVTLTAYYNGNKTNMKKVFNKLIKADLIEKKDYFKEYEKRKVIGRLE